MKNEIKEEVVQEEEVPETKTATEQEEVTEEELNKYKRTFHNQKVVCIGVEIDVKNNKTQAILVLEDSSRVTYKLQKEVKKETFSEKLGMKVKETYSETVTKDELNDQLPKIFTDIARYVNEHGSIVLHISYSQTALSFADGIKIYKYFRDYYVETIYSPDLHKDKERLNKQLEMAKKSKERQEVNKVKLA